MSATEAAIRQQFAQLPQPSDHQRQWFERFLLAGMPTSKSEEWKYVETKALLPESENPPAIQAPDLQGADAGSPWQLGNTELSSDALPSDDPFACLNLAFNTSPLSLLLPADTVASEPLVVHPRGSYTRLRLDLETGAKAQLAIYGQGNCLLELNLAPSSSLELGYFQEDGPEDVHLANLRANIREGARLDLFSFAMGGKLSKKKFVAELLDSHAHCSLNGLYVLDGSSSDHEQVTVRHRQPHATSSQLFKGILNDRSRAEFSGTIEVDPGAIKTDAQQLCRNLLLSSEAQVHTRPQLRILADDVKCSHGATTGQLDQEQILYLRSRGLSPESAIRMLTYGFAREVVERCHIDTLRQQLESRLTKLG